MRIIDKRNQLNGQTLSDKLNDKTSQNAQKLKSLHSYKVKHEFAKSLFAKRKCEQNSETNKSDESVFTEKDFKNFVLNYS